MSHPDLPPIPASIFEWTELRPDASRDDVRRLCQSAVEHLIHAVCVSSGRVTQAYDLLEEMDVRVAAMVGFPDGASDGDVKRFEAEAAVDSGAHELNVVLNSGRLKDGENGHVLRELRDVVEAADERPVTVFVSESLLSEEEKTTACGLILDSGAQWVGVLGDSAGGRVEEEIVQLVRDGVGGRLGVKVLGSISDEDEARRLLAAGATRLLMPWTRPLLRLEA